MTPKLGILASLLLGALLMALALSVNFPKANGGGFKGDESTYYMLAHSLARDFDFQYERKDLSGSGRSFQARRGSSSSAAKISRFGRPAIFRTCAGSNMRIGNATRGCTFRSLSSTHSWQRHSS